MVIGKFNRFFARHGRAAFIVILLLIGIPFIFFFGVDTQAFTQNASSSKTVAYVDDKPVTETEFRRHLVSIALRSRDANLGRSDFWQESASAVFTRVHMLHVAAEKGLGDVSDEEVQRWIKRAGFNNEKGEFDIAVFRNFKNGYLRQAGLTATDFDQLVRDDIVIGRLYEPYRQGFTVSDLEERYSAASMNLKVGGQITRFFVHDNTVGLNFTDEEVQSYYDTNKGGELKVPARKELVVVYSDASDFMSSRPEVTDEMLKEYYEAHKEDYKVHEVQASHILFKVPADATDEFREQQRQKAEKVLKEALAPGADFAALAKKYSDERWSGEKGGDVGYFEESERQGWGPVAFKLKDGETSKELAESNFGFHIVKRIGGRETYKSLDEVKNMIRYEVYKSLEEKQFGDRARAYFDKNMAGKPEREVEASHILILASSKDSPTAVAEKREKLQKILDEARAGADFAELAKKYSDDKGSAKNGGELGWIKKNGRMVEPFETAALATKKGEISDIVTTTYGFHIIKVFDEKFAPRKYEEEKDSIIRKLRKDESDQARDKAKSLIEGFNIALYENAPFIKATPEQRANAFNTFATTYAADHEGLHVETPPAFSVDAASISGLPAQSSDLIEAARDLTMGDPLIKKIVESGNVSYIACLKTVLPAYEPELDKDLRAKIITTLRDQKGKSIAFEKAEKAGKAIQAALDAGKSFDEAKGDYEFEKIAPFNLMQGPKHDADYDNAIVAIASRTPEGHMSTPESYEYGVVLMYVDSVKIDHISMVQQLDYMGNMYENMMAQTMQGQLENQYTSETSYVTTKAWDWLAGDPKKNAEGAAAPAPTMPE